MSVQYLHPKTKSQEFIAICHSLYYYHKLVPLTHSCNGISVVSLQGFLSFFSLLGVAFTATKNWLPVLHGPYTPTNSLINKQCHVAALNFNAVDNYAL